MTETATEFDDTTRPCRYCGRPVPQRQAVGHPFRYCQDNDGACQRAARNARLRARSSPGLTGQVARTHEVAERLEQVVGTLIDALHDELSPEGVERQLAEVRAQSAAEVAAAHAERDDARKAAVDARDSTTAALARADEAEATRQVAAEALTVAREAADEADARARQAQEAAHAADAAATVAATEREAARREAATEAALRAEAYRERDAARDGMRERDASLAAAERSLRERAEAEARLERRLDAATSRADAAEAATVGAREEADRAHGWVEDLRGQLVVSREQTREAQESAAAAVRARDRALAQAGDAGVVARTERGRADVAEAELVALRRRVAELDAQVSNLAAALERLTAPVPEADEATVAG